jgi:hypothetical protein
MKTKLILFIISVLFTSHCFAVEMDERDKQYHMGASYALQTSSSLILKNKYKFKAWQAALYGALGTLAIGVAKEYAIDKQADPQDIQADMLGVGIAVPVVFFEF